ncbi:DUF58 domain-containing protein [Chitinophaga sp. RAB17]|uniref:DUF58 domain-containing protein n=1 Tax=Chitinophaga sp. RAB17 TaxID=3233049 RepID=UPI003F8DE4CA
MMGKKNDTAAKTYPPGVVITLEELMRYEYYVQDIPLLPQHPVYTILAGRHASKLRGRGLDFEEVRIYVPGDDIRNIDWKVTARTGETHSKVFNEEKERPTFVVVDQTTRLFFGSQQQVKSVVAAQVAALSAFYTVRRGDRVGGIVFNEERNDFIPSARSKSHVQHLLTRIADMNALLPTRTHIRPAPVALNEILHKTGTLVTHDYVVTVISDFSIANEDTFRYLQHIAAHNDVMLVHITDPLEAALPDGSLALSDGIRQVLWNNNNRHNGDRYTENFENMKSTLTERCRNYHIPIIFIDAGAEVSNQIIHFFGKTNH